MFSRFVLLSFILLFSSVSQAKFCQSLFLEDANKSFKAQKFHKALSWIPSGKVKAQKSLTRQLNEYFKLSKDFESYFFVSRLLKDKDFLELLIKDNNILVQRLKRILDLVGEKAKIETVELSQDGYPNMPYFRLDLGVLDAPHILPLKKLKLFKDHDGVSHIYFDFIDTGISSAYGYFNSSSRHIVLGKYVMEAILKYGDSSTTTLHEFSHAALSHNMRFPYNLGFISKKPFYKEAMYETYMSSQELYTFANTLFVRAKAIAKPFEKTKQEVVELLEALYKDSQRLEMISKQSLFLANEYSQITSSLVKSKDVLKSSEGNAFWAYVGKNELGQNQIFLVKDYKTEDQKVLKITDTTLTKDQLYLLSQVQSVVFKYEVQSVSELAEKSLTAQEQQTLRFFTSDALQIQKQIFKSITRAQYELAILSYFYLEKLPEYNKKIKQAYDQFAEYLKNPKPSLEQQTKLEDIFLQLFQVSRELAAKSRPEYQGYIGRDI